MRSCFAGRPLLYRAMHAGQATASMLGMCYQRLPGMTGNAGSAATTSTAPGTHAGGMPPERPSQARRQQR